MNTPFSVVQPNNFVRNTEFQTEVDNLTNCGAHMTSSGSGGITITSLRSWFQNSNEVQIVSYGNDAPTKTERSGSGGGFGFKINKTGYYELYGTFRFYGDFVKSESVMSFEFEDEDGNFINTDNATDQRTERGRWITTNGINGNSYSIARIHDNVSCGVRLNKGDCAYFVGNPVVNPIKAHLDSLYFGIKFIATNPELI